MAIDATFDDVVQFVRKEVQTIKAQIKRELATEAKMLIRNSARVIEKSQIPTPEWKGTVARTSTVRSPRVLDRID